MSVAKHTPGPWSVKAASFADNGGINYTVLALGIRACKADANLIASAPDLLAENERLRDALVEVRDMVGSNQIWNIINKALGEGA